MITINSNYGKHMMAFIESQGYSIRQHDNIFISSNDVAVQAIMDTFDPTPAAKLAKISELKSEAAKRANVIYGFLSGEDDETDASDVQAFYNFAVDIYTSILPAARGTLQPRLQAFKDIRDTAVASTIIINGFPTLLDVENYDVVNTPVWP